MIVQRIGVLCPDCGFDGDVEAEVDHLNEVAYWTCPTTLCERNGNDAKATEYFSEEPDNG